MKADGISLDDTQSKLKALYAKQGRAAQFPTQTARDNFLEAEITSLKAFEEQHTRQLEDIQHDVEEAEKRAAEAEAHVGELETADGERREKLLAMADEIAEVKASIDGMQEQRKYVGDRSWMYEADGVGICGERMESLDRRSQMLVPRCKRQSVRYRA